jgi:hypothetical protein
MSAKHRTPEYQRNARTIRKRVRAQHAAGQAVRCWRCPLPILPGQPFDVGHLPGAVGSSLHELAPEHRGENRSDGGRRGAAKTNARHAPTVPTTKTKTWNI